MDDRDLYAELGVVRGATPEEIRSAYRRLARETHPDVNPNNPQAEERFKEISFAYDILSDPAKQARYDEFGMQGLADGFDPDQARAYQRWSEGAKRSPQAGFYSSEGEVDLEDLLGGLFGRRAGGPRRGFDVEAEVEVDFLDAALARQVRVQVAGRPALEVAIPPGSNTGSRIRLRGQGEPGPAGGERGDLTLTLRVRPHPRYTRRGADLFLELPATIPELVLGGPVLVPTPHGEVKMTIPAHSQNGRKLRLRGKGARHRGKDGHGDLYLTLVATLPSEGGEKLQALAREMQAFYADEDVRADFGSAS